MNTDAAPSWLPRQLVPFFTLSYPLPQPANPDSFPDSSYYGTGYLDLCFVVAWVAFLGIVRDLVRVRLCEPFARWYLTRQDDAADRRIAAKRKLKNGTTLGDEKTNGYVNGSAAPHAGSASPKKPSKREQLRERAVLRFGEQGYQFVYFCIYWSYGLYLHTGFPHSPWRLEYLWKDYPHFPLAAPVKFYYLTQAAFWLHSVLVLNAEERRKDHVQMMAHHFVTISLLATSYAGNYSRVGCIILFITDWCDIWLPVAKMFRYLGFTSFCDVLFAIFTLSWVVTRQIMFSLVFVSTYKSVKLLPYKWDPEAGHYLNHYIYIGFVTLLGTLVVMLAIWSATLFAVVFQVLKGAPPGDSRSDDEFEAAINAQEISDVNTVDSVVEPFAHTNGKAVAHENGNGHSNGKGKH